MGRRNVLRWLAGLASIVRVWSQTVAFPGAQAGTLRSVAAVVIPSTVDANRIADQFIRYVREYRPGADTEHGYGFTRVRPKPPSPAADYTRQLAALANPVTREAVAAAMEEAQLKDLPRIPDGNSLIADLMSFYFRSAEANDLCYRAAIARDTCRGLPGSSLKPAPLKERT